MGITERNFKVFFIFFFIILLVSPQLLEAARPMKGEQWVKNEDGFLLQIRSSLQRGTVPSSGPNPCTNIPGQSTGRCTIEAMNVAGSIIRSPPAFSVAQSSPQLLEAVRPVKGDQWANNEDGFLLQIRSSLQRGTVPSSGRNPCTNIPGQSTGRCTIEAMNVGGSIIRSPPAFSGP